MRRGTTPGTARTRGVLTTAAAVVLVLLALLGADVGSRTAAERLVADDIQAATGADQEPRVEIAGRLFLPQVVRGAYDRVEVQVVGIDEGPLRVDRVDAELVDVRVPFHDVLVRDVRAIGVAESRETARLSYSALNAYLQATGRPLTVAPAPAGGVVLTGEVSVLDRRLSATAETDLQVSEGNLLLVPRTVTSNDPALGATARLLLTQRLTITVPLAGLPFSQQLESVDATTDGLVVHARGTGVVLQP